MELPSPIHHGLHSDKEREMKMYPVWIVAIPYSSRVAFGQRLHKRRFAFSVGCHPLFITGCIRTFITCVVSDSMQVAIPYSSRVAFGLDAMEANASRFLTLPSPIHHGLHSDNILKNWIKK